MFGTNDQEERFAQLAKEITSQADATTETLTKNILKVAKANEFNSEQIKRLSEATNQSMYNKMLNNGENKFDKTASFPIVDPKQIISEYYDQETDLNKVASVVSKGMSTYYLSPEKLFMEKVAESSTDTVMEPEPLSSPAPEFSDSEYFEKLSLAKSVRDRLNSERCGLQLKISECIDKLACAFTLVDGPDQEQFEKKAYFIYGNKSLPFLNLVREQLGMRKLAGFSGEVKDVVIDPNTEDLTILKEAMSSAKDYVKINKAYEQFRGVVGDF
jgi:hypothetical protein